MVLKSLKASLAGIEKSQTDPEPSSRRFLKSLEKVSVLEVYSEKFQCCLK